MKLLAIAGLTLRTAIRSRVFALLLAIVILSIAGLPLILQSDGTAAGQTQLFLHYAFGLSMALLSVAAAWSAAGAIALEVSGRQMHVLLTKPVHAAEIWLGKWIGLMAINIIMVTLAGGLIYALLLWNTRPAALPDSERSRLRDEILTAHSLVRHANAADDAPVAPAVKRAMLAVPPNGTQSWKFTVPRHTREGNALFLQFSFATSRVERQTPVAGLWLVAPDDSAMPHRLSGIYTPHLPHTLKLPPARPGQRLTITYQNTDAAAPATVLFDADTGTQLMIRESGFESNFIRALLLALARLAFLTALGLSAGALFSFPVAAFVTFAFLFISGLSNFVSPASFIAEGEGAPAWLAALFNALVRGLIQASHWITPPLARFDPLNFLPVGAFIPWPLVGTAWMVLALCYGGALAVMGIWIFSRREMGLAAT